MNPALCQSFPGRKKARLLASGDGLEGHPDKAMAPGRGARLDGGEPNLNLELTRSLAAAGVRPAARGKAVLAHVHHGMTPWPRDGCTHLEPTLFLMLG